MVMIMLGKTIKFLREEKGFSQKYIAKDIFKSSQISKIENDDQKITADNFIKLLYRLSITFDEFCFFTKNKHISARVKTRSYVAELGQNGNPSQLKEGIKKMDEYHEEFKDVYFKHMCCVLKATYILSTTDNDYEKARKELTPITEYLISTENWFYYELALFTNILYLYSPPTAISEGNRVLKKINEHYERFKDYDITRSLLINLAIYSLDEKLYMQSFEFSSKVLALPQSTDHLYDILLAKIVNQVACFRLRSSEYSINYLSNLIDTLKVLSLDAIHKQVLDFVTKHDIRL